jgi:hypothetical protein
MLVALDEALERLALPNKRLSQVVEYRYFGGLNRAGDRRGSRCDAPDRAAGLGQSARLAVPGAARLIITRRELTDGRSPPRALG